MGKEQAKQTRDGMKARWNKVAEDCPGRKAAGKSRVKQASQDAQVNQNPQGAQTQKGQTRQENAQGSPAPQEDQTFTSMNQQAVELLRDILGQPTQDQEEQEPLGR